MKIIDAAQQPTCYEFDKLICSLDAYGYNRYILKLTQEEIDNIISWNPEAVRIDSKDNKIYYKGMHQIERI